MCLWFVSVCPECGKFTPLVSENPLICDRPLCQRIPLDPHWLAPMEKQLFLKEDEPCGGPRCSDDTCGLLTTRRYYCCTHAHLLNVTSDSDSESSQDSEYDSSSSSQLVIVESNHVSSPCSVLPLLSTV